MVQVFMVLRCYSCHTFQVHQVKKSNKWNCKVCNEKQSVIKIYGKGAAADCRRHVQKLNMMRAEKEQLENEEQLQSSSHPPEEYADAFTVQDIQPEEIPQHPVVLAGKSAGRSKWTSFIEPEDEDEEGEEASDRRFTTDKEEFARAQNPRKQVKRSASDRGSHPLSSRTNLPSSSLSSSKDKVVPYSCVSQEMEDKLDDLTDKFTSSKSIYKLPVSDRYRKLDEDSFVYDTRDDLLGTTPASLSGSAGNIMTGTSLSLPSNHKDSMARIREDIGRYKRENPPPDKGGDDRGGSKGELSEKETAIPKVSSKWTQFMCEESEEEGDDEEQLLLRGAGLVASGYTVAQYSAPIQARQN